MRIKALTFLLFSLLVETSQARTPKAPSAKAVLEPLAVVIADAVGVDRTLALSIIAQESQWNPMVISPKGAMGLMQLMPRTAAAYGVQNPYDPVENLIAGLYHFRLLQRQYRDDRLALAAYNAGEGAVKKYAGIPPYRETVNYVRQILARQTKVESPSADRQEVSASAEQLPQLKAVSPYEAETALDLSGLNSSDIELFEKQTETAPTQTPTAVDVSRSAPRS